MPTYNGAAYLRAQLDSILAQHFTHWFLLIRDDGSTDGTTSILEEYAIKHPGKFELIPSFQRLGVVGSIEELLLHASHRNVDAICLADQDDIWLPNKLQDTIPYLREYTMVVHDATLIDANEQLIHPSFFLKHQTKPGFWNNLKRNSYLGCCMLFRPAVLQKALPFPNRVPMHDIWLGNVAARMGQVAFLPEPLVKYRRHGNNASSTSEASTQSTAKKIQDRVVVLASLTKRGLMS